MYVTLLFVFIDPVISNLAVDPTMVAVLESACPDSDPHDSFILVCRAMKPSVVIPELMLQWLHNGSMRAGNVSVTNSGTCVVNTLNISDARVNDSGVYTCVARIVIPESIQPVSATMNSTVDVISELSCLSLITIAINLSLNCQYSKRDIIISFS